MGGERVEIQHYPWYYNWGVDFPTMGVLQSNFAVHLKGFDLMNTQTFSFFEYMRAPLVVQPLV